MRLSCGSKELSLLHKKQNYCSGRYADALLYRAAVFHSATSASSHPFPASPEGAVFPFIACMQDFSHSLFLHVIANWKLLTCYQHGCHEVYAATAIVALHTRHCIATLLPSRNAHASVHWVLVMFGTWAFREPTIIFASQMFSAPSSVFLAFRATVS